jgi:hypothetical protein
VTRPTTVGRGIERLPKRRPDLAARELRLASCMLLSFERPSVQ